MYRSGRCFALSRTAPQASACSGRVRDTKQGHCNGGVARRGVSVVRDFETGGILI